MDEETAVAEGTIPSGPASGAGQGEDGGAGASGGQVESPSNVDASQQGRRGNPEFARMRVENRRLRQEIESIKTQFQGMNGGGPTSGKKSFWEDPEGVLKEHADKTRSEMRQEIGAQSAKRDAYNWFLSQDGVTPDVEDSVADLIESDPDLMELLNKKPLVALKYAFAEVAGTRRSSSPSKKAQAVSVKGSPAGVGAGKSPLTMGEVRRIAKNPAEFQKRKSEIMAFVNKAEGQGIELL